MKIRFFAFLFVIYSGLCFTIRAEEAIPFRVQRVNERITFFTPGKYVPPATMTVITTPKGLIVIDTLLSPTLAEQAMQQAKKELGRDDVLLVINTHSHEDHTNGNQVFKGKEIIGHENVIPAMKRYADEAAASQPRIIGRIMQREWQLKTLAPDTPQALALAEANRIDRLMNDDMQNCFVSTPPTKIFNDKLVVQAGGLELRLYYFGRSHTDSAIVIHVPKLGVLFSGDLFHTDFISVTAAPWPMTSRAGWPFWMKCSRPHKEIKTVIGGHMLVYPRQWLDAQHRYIKKLWAAVTQAKKEGAIVGSIPREYAPRARLLLPGVPISI